MLIRLKTFQSDLSVSTRFKHDILKSDTVVTTVLYSSSVTRSFRSSFQNIYSRTNLDRLQPGTPLYARHQTISNSSRHTSLSKQSFDAPINVVNSDNNEQNIPCLQSEN